MKSVFQNEAFTILAKIEIKIKLIDCHLIDGGGGKHQGKLRGINKIDLTQM